MTRRSKPPALPRTEAGLLRAVLELAKLRGWRALHLRPARTRKGWRTAVQGDGAGFPDLLLCRGPHLIAAELKGPRGRLTPEQCDWLAALAAAGAQTYVWTPDDWDQILEVLR